MDIQNIQQKGNQFMNSTEQKPAFIVFEPRISLDDGDFLDVAAAGLQFHSRVDRVSTDVLLDLDIMKYDGKVHSDIIDVSRLLDLLEQAHRIINSGIFSTLMLESSYSGVVRDYKGKPSRVFIQEREPEQYSINY